MNNQYTQLRLNIFSIAILVFLLCACSKSNDFKTENYILNIVENCTDTLSLQTHNEGIYYHCGIGVTFNLRYHKEKNNLSAIILDYEYQYKPSKKVPIAEFKYEIITNDLKLISINYLHDHYIGEFRHLNRFVNTIEFKRSGLN